jgi:hypothetical protein
LRIPGKHAPSIVQESPIALPIESRGSATIGGAIGDYRIRNSLARRAADGRTATAANSSQTILPASIHTINATEKVGSTRRPGLLASAQP